MSSSVTVTTSSTSLLTWSYVRSPGHPTQMPSAIVRYDWSRTGCPAFSEGGYAAAPAACTPTTRMSGRNAFAATAIPEISPPPPIPVMIVFTSGSASTISSPTVP